MGVFMHTIPKQNGLKSWGILAGGAPEVWGEEGFASPFQVWTGCHVDTTE